MTTSADRGDRLPSVGESFLGVDMAQGSTLDGVRLLAEIQTPDELTLRFSGWGFGGRLEPADSAEFLAEQMAQSTLHAEVPQDVRATFARAQKVFIYGLLEADSGVLAIVALISP